MLRFDLEVVPECGCVSANAGPFNQQPCSPWLRSAPAHMDPEDCKR